MKKKRNISYIKEKKRKKILNNSLKLFAKYSYHRTTMELIAKKCGISKGLIYTYFKSKDDILKTLFKEGIAKILLSVEKFSEIKTEEEFASLVRTLVNVITKNKDFFDLYFSLFNENILNKKFRQQIKKDMSVLYGLFESYYANKGYKSPELMAYTIVSALDGLAIDYITFYELPIEQMTEILIQKFK